MISLASIQFCLFSYNNLSFLFSSAVSLQQMHGPVYRSSSSAHVLLFSAPDVQSCSFSILSKASVLEKQGSHLFSTEKKWLLITTVQFIIEFQLTRQLFRHLLLYLFMTADMPYFWLSSFRTHFIQFFSVLLYSEKYLRDL